MMKQEEILDLLDSGSKKAINAKVICKKDHGFWGKDNMYEVDILELFTGKIATYLDSHYAPKNSYTTFESKEKYMEVFTILENKRKYEYSIDFRTGRSIELNSKK